jgi:hypothetical protein
MTDQPDFVVSTAYGPLDIHVHSGDYARVEIGIPMNVDERSFTINGVAHAVQARMHRWSDGRWHLGQEDDRTSQLYEPRLSRRERVQQLAPEGGEPVCEREGTDRHRGGRQRAPERTRRAGGWLHLRTCAHWRRSWTAP